MGNKPSNAEIILKIPISNATLQNGYVELFSDEQYIGNLPNLIVAGKTFMYDTDERNLNKLSWHLIYQKHKETIDNKISELLNADDLEITIGNFRRLYVKKSNGELICSVICVFEENEWNVYKEN